MTKDVLFLDMDETLGYFRPGGSGIYPGVAQFLESQKSRDREMHVVTTASESQQHFLDPIASYLSGFWGREFSSKPFYVRDDGLWAECVRGDHRPEGGVLKQQYFKYLKERFSLEEQYGVRSGTRERSLKKKNCPSHIRSYHAQICVEIESLDEKLRSWYDVATGEKLIAKDVCSSPPRKNFPVIEQMVSRSVNSPIRSVMVGNLSDEWYLAVSSHIPLIMVAPSDVSGSNISWPSVSLGLDMLFDPAGTPAENFDCLYHSTKASQDGLFIPSEDGGLLLEKRAFEFPDLDASVMVRVMKVLDSSDI